MTGRKDKSTVSLRQLDAQAYNGLCHFWTRDMGHQITGALEDWAWLDLIDSFSLTSMLNRVCSYVITAPSLLKTTTKKHLFKFSCIAGVEL